ncbi:hypothetical protein [Rufibacter latericius]|uniref:Uncharacterized protein n=1 Tax=Rufibacter latericius TaxID=2487040 RepID=A0A3M9MUA6_9BACT|nr:hypothetical protein [Rufibacter latericius]RNI29089.1 hypothetical protein EFB08_06565 [Rufibacter latericius]
MSKLPEHFIWLNFKYLIELTTLFSPDVLHAVDELNADITFQHLDDDDEHVGEPVIIGELELLYFNLGWVRANLVDHMSLGRPYSSSEDALIDMRVWRIKDNIKQQIGGVSNGNILFVNKFIIYPEFRNQGLGEEVMRGVIKHFEFKCGYVGLKSTPLQC